MSRTKAVLRFAGREKEEVKEVKHDFLAHANGFCSRTFLESLVPAAAYNLPSLRGQLLEGGTNTKRINKQK